MDKSVVEINHNRLQLMQFLGDDKTRRYYQYLKSWFSGKSQKEDFDQSARALFTPQSIHLHNQFLLSLLNNCDIRVSTYGTEGKHDGAFKALKRSISRAKRLKKNQSFQKSFSPAPLLSPKNVAEVLLHRKEETAEECPAVPSASTAGFLPDQSMTAGRLLVSCWENDLDGTAEDVPMLVLAALQALLKNIFTVAVELKKSHSVKDGRLPHMFGVESRLPSLQSRDKDQNLLALNSQFDHMEARDPLVDTGETPTVLGVRDFLCASMVMKSVIPNVELREKLLERLLYSWRHSTEPLEESSRSVQLILNRSMSDSEDMSS